MNALVFLYRKILEKGSSPFLLNFHTINIDVDYGTTFTTIIP